MQRARTPWLFWLLAAALVWASVAPAVARWATADTPERVEVCTSTGVAWVAVDNPDSPSDTGSSMACDWCLTHAAGWAPPIDDAHLAHDVAVDAVPVGNASWVPAARAAWVRPWLRAPPMVL
ncbi:MAG: DUF2946 family protein [Tepidimonas sp.]|uniref:DUF2946 family protein n=1 Tax=Tepidimonas sp. TaxID=2002775 RepID=UPI004054F4A1